MDPFVALGVLSSVLPIALIVLILVAVIGGRYEPDPGRERPLAVYLSAACFVGVFVLLGAFFVVVVSLLGLTTESDSYSASASDTFSRRNPAATLEFAPVPGDIDSAGEGSFDEDLTAQDDIGSSQTSFSYSGTDEEDNRDITSAVNAGIVALVALAILVFHDPKLTRLVAGSRGPGARVYAKHLYVLCFVAVIAFLGAGAVALSSGFAALAPGVTGVDSRTDALRQLGSAGALALGAAVIFIRHWRRAAALATTAPVVEETPVADPPTTRGRIRRAAPPVE